MPQLSILIPWVDSVERLEATLVSVLENQPADTQVVVALGREYDDPYSLAGEVRLVPCLAQSTLLQCIQTGLEACDGLIVHVLGTGLEVTAGWTDSVLAHFDDPSVAAVAPRVIQREGHQERESYGVLYGSGGQRIVRGNSETPDHATTGIWGPELRAAFYRKSALEAVGGFSEAVGPHYCDVDLALMLEAAGYQRQVEPQSAVIDTQDAVPLQGAFQQGLTAERLFWRSAPAVGWLRALLTHPGTVLQESIRAKSVIAVVAQMLGRTVACTEVLQYRRHHRLLNELKLASQVLAADPAAVKKFRIDGAHVPPAPSFSSQEPPRRAA